jgi:hypothetical protein
MELRLDPQFEQWLTTLSTDNELLDVYADIVALLDALATNGQQLIEPESKPIQTDAYLHELRRTPPSDAAPLADQPPIIRVLYAFCRTTTGQTSLAAIKPSSVTTGIPKTSCLPKPVS